MFLAETASDPAPAPPLPVDTTKEVCSSLIGPRLNIHDPFSLANSRALASSALAASASSTRRRRLPLRGKRLLCFLSLTLTTLAAALMRSW